ncbi:MAG: ROK family protein, partial [Terriglobales bacterium]
MANYSIGVDLGGTNLRIAAVDERGNLVEKTTLGTRVAMGRDHVVNDMCAAIQQLSEKHNNSGKLLGIGIGVPGIIDMETGMVRESPNLPDWADYPVRAEIETRLGTRVVLENDANSAAFGEKWLGVAKDVDDMAMLTLGTGVGGGLVLGGRIWHGMAGMAAEFGHTTVEPEGALCGCGNRG